MRIRLVPPWLRLRVARRRPAQASSRRNRSAKPRVETLENRWLLSLNQFALLTPAAAPLGIAAGSDGALWFTEQAAAQIGRVTVDGQMTEFGPALTPHSHPGHLTAGGDGALWFTEPGSNQIGRITTGGAVTEYPLPTPAADPQGITLGPDGAVWFTERAVDQVGRIDPSGQITEYRAPWVRPTPSGFQGIVTGPDGALWFTEQLAGAIGRVTPAGSFSEYGLPPQGSPNDITAGPDGALWFTENPAEIGRISTDGQVTEFGPRVLNSFYGDLTAGSDGAVWFVVNNTIGLPQLGRITPKGAQSFIPVAAPFPLGDITTGPDSNLWFAETGGDAIGQWVIRHQVSLGVLPVAGTPLTSVPAAGEVVPGGGPAPAPPAGAAGDPGSLAPLPSQAEGLRAARSGDALRVGVPVFADGMEEGLAGGGAGDTLGELL